LHVSEIDTGQLIRVPGYKPGERQLEVTDVFRSLKQLAKELSVPLIALAQLSREAEGQRPTLAHLRESGAIENEADVVILMHGERDAAALTAIIAKNRGGRTCEVPLVFLRAQYRIELPTQWKAEEIR
jgi:replicative DNA helicase